MIKKKSSASQVKNPSEVIELIQDKLPALYFVFGRAKAEAMAVELGKEWDFLYSSEKKRVRQLIAEMEKDFPDMFMHRDRAALKKLMMQGIGYHHAGLSMPLKRVVEQLYEERLIWVLFCTETFAAGVNFPAASAVLESCRKWDGKEFRKLLNREFFQMAGRAGRRGFDVYGNVFIQIDKDYPEDVGFFNESQVEMVQGRLVISPNTVLNLLMWKSDEEIDYFLRNNFSAFQKRLQLKECEKHIESIEKFIKEKGDAFCDKRFSNCCPLSIRKLKQELKSLKNKKHINPNIKMRIAEIKSILKRINKNKCNLDECRQLEMSLKRMRKNLKMLYRTKEDLKCQAEQYIVEFNRMRELLERLGYIKGREFLPRGKFALNVHVQEIFVTELVFSGVVEEWPIDIVAGILAGVEYIPGRREYVKDAPYNVDFIFDLRENLIDLGVPEEQVIWSHVPGYIAYAWYNGCDFAHLLESSNLQEGDLISIIRREIDLLRQIEKSAGDNLTLVKRVREIRRRLDRDQMRVLL